MSGDKEDEGRPAQGSEKGTKSGFKEKPGFYRSPKETKGRKITRRPDE
jgi:hypothetical protein